MSSSDTAEIEQIQRDFMAHWSAGDAASCARAYAEDGVRVGARGDIQRGRGEIEQAYASLFSGPFRGARVTGTEARIRMLGQEYALYQAGFTITPPQGQPIHGYAVDVMRKIQGRWWVQESHPKLFPPPPAKT